MHRTPSEKASELVPLRPFVRRVVARLSSNGADAEDLEQQVWLRVLQSPPRHDGAPKAWLGRVARTTAWSQFKVKARRDEHEARYASERPPEEDEPEADDLTECRAALEGALRDLPGPYSEVLILRYYEDLSPSEIAERLGLSIHTVHTRHRRALERLRNKLGSSPESFLRRLGGMFAFLRPRNPQVALGLGAAATLLVLTGIVAVLHLTGRGPFDSGAVALIDAPGDVAAPAEDALGAPGVAGRLAATGQPLESPGTSGQGALAALATSGELLVQVVRGPEQEPVQNLLVDAWRQGASAADAAVDVRTSEHGTVTLSDLTPGLWSVSTPLSPAQTVEVEAGREQRVLLRLEESLAVRGVVQTSKRRPLANATVRASFPHDLERSHVIAVSDEEGRFEAQGVSPDAWIAADLPGYRVGSWRLAAEFDREQEAVGTLRLLPGKGTTVEVVDSEGRPVVGAQIQQRLLVGAGASSVSPLGTIRRREPPPVLTDDEGRASLTRFSFLKSRIRITLADGTFCERELAIVDLNSVYRNGKRPFRVCIQTQDLRPPVTSSGPLHLRCFNQDGDPEGGATVLLGPIPDVAADPASFRTPLAASYRRFRASPDGRVTVGERTDSDQRVWLMESADPGARCLGWLDLESAPDEELALVAQRDSGVFAATQTGSPGPEERLIAVSADVPHAQVLRLDGKARRFEFDLLPSTYAVYHWRVGTLHEVGGPEPRSLEAGQFVDLGPLGQPQSGEIHLRLVWPPGTSLRGASVTIVPLDEEAAGAAAQSFFRGQSTPNASLSEDGVFEHHGLGPGFYAFFVSGSKCKSVEFAVRLGPGERHERTIEFVRGKRTLKRDSDTLGWARGVVEREFPEAIEAVR